MYLRHCISNYLISQLLYGIRIASLQLANDTAVFVNMFFRDEDNIFYNKMLSYRRETALQGTLVLAESGRLKLRDNILLIL